MWGPEFGPQDQRKNTRLGGMCLWQDYTHTHTHTKMKQLNMTIRSSRGTNYLHGVGKAHPFPGPHFCPCIVSLVWWCSTWDAHQNTEVGDKTSQCLGVSDLARWGQVLGVGTEWKNVVGNWGLWLQLWLALGWVSFPWSLSYQKKWVMSGGHNQEDHARLLLHLRKGPLFPCFKHGVHLSIKQKTPWWQS